MHVRCVCCATFSDNRKPTLDSDPTYLSLLGVDLVTNLEYSDADGDDVTVGLYNSAPDAITLYYNGYFEVDGSLTTNISLTIQLTDSRFGMSLHEITVNQYDCPCMNGGSCTQTDIHRPPTCVCVEGFLGSVCDQRADPCGPGFCYHGHCVGMSCVCDAGYEGDECGQSLTTTTTPLTDTVTMTSTTTTTPPITPGVSTASTAPTAAWSPWGQWSACSKQCDFGTRVRDRVCLKGVTCPGSSVSREICNAWNCPGRHKLVLATILRGCSLSDFEQNISDDSGLTFTA